MLRKVDKRITVEPLGSMGVSVYGIDFIWTVHDTGHVIVQHASGHGCCLVIETSNEFLPEYASVLIELAMDADWEPQVDGPNHWFRFHANPGAFRISDIDSHDELL
ncbi:MAG TPA: hypothetical protein VMM76_05450 [Pirellulaceae bacterium]|nr:hypothetical protein [Pirellulaceae bacterium]